MTSSLLSDKNLRRVVYSAVLAAIGYMGFVLWGGWDDALAGIDRVGILGIAAALLLSLVNYALRFMRWQWFLRNIGTPPSWRLSMEIYLSGFALTTTPAKSGEALRSIFLKQHGIGFASSLAALVTERLYDLLAVTLLAIIGLIAYPEFKQVVLLGLALVLVAYYVVWSRSLHGLVAKIARPTTRVSKLFAHLASVLKQAQMCCKPRYIPFVTVLSVTAWLAEAYALFLILKLLGLDISLIESTFIYSVAMLAGALSFLPGGLGSSEAVMVSLLVLSGADSANAVVATVLIRLATLWFAVVLGIAFAGRCRARLSPAGES